MVVWGRMNRVHVTLPASRPPGSMSDLRLQLNDHYPVMLRVPQINLTALLAQDNPSIDLKIQAYETSTRNFLKAVTDYKESVKAQITDRRNKQLNEKKKTAEKTKAVEDETEKCKLKEIELVAGALCIGFTLVRNMLIVLCSLTARAGRKQGG